jgi:preprotein translocase subunit SecE
MAKEANTALNPLWRDLFSLGVYKRSQGRIARQVTYAALVIVIALGAWSLQQFLADKVAPSGRYGISTAVLLVGMWIGYRLVNVPRFADFLIAVEAEMNKVSWPTRGELFRSSIVVMITIFGLAIVLWAYDAFWTLLLTWLKVLGRG